jgi:4-amino-4-deoxy-L-arabinose transferase-like glycosyltransferase
VFWAWLLLRTAGWTALAALSQPNASLDLVEWLSWGREWQWGYHKHPPLPAWLAEVSSRLTPGSVTGVYLAGYLLTALCLYSAWALGRRLLAPRLALLSALALDGLIYFTYDSAEFSNNVVLNACWALAVLTFHGAVTTRSTRWWLALGLVVGFGMLTKYTLGLLLLPMLGVLLLAPGARRCWAHPGPYLGALVALLVFLPHALWAARHDFATLKYGLDRSAPAAHWLGALESPLFFSLSQVGRLLPVLFILVPLTSYVWRLRAPAPGEGLDRQVLLALVAGPVALLLVLSLATGRQLREIWGSPLWTFAPLTLLFLLRVEAGMPALARAGRRWGAVVVLVVGYALLKNSAPSLHGSPGRIHFPGRALAEGVARRWGACEGRPFPVVAGDCWLAGNIGCYAAHRPSVYPSCGLGYLVMDPKATPWTGDDDVRRRGGVVVWDAGQLGCGLPPELARHFPGAEVQAPVVLAPHCRAPEVRVGLAFVRPGRLHALARGGAGSPR